MRPAHYAWLTAREVRGSRRRLALFMACLAVGVGAIVAVGTLAASVRQGMRQEAKKLLGADVTVTSRRPLPENLDQLLEEVSLSTPGEIQRTTVRELVTVAAVPGRNGEIGASRLVELKVVDGEYPLYGTLDLDPAQPLGELLAPETAVVAPELLGQLGLKIGDPLMIGGRTYRIAGTVRGEPDRLAFTLSVGPRVFLTAEGLERASAIGRGFRLRNAALFRLPGDAPEADAAALRSFLSSRMPTGASYRVRSYINARPRMRRNLDRVSSYLGLVGLLSLLIGGVGVAQTVRAWIAERIDAIAVMRCLGMRPREIVTLYATQTALLGLAGSALGAALGVGLAFAVPTVILPDLVPPEFVHPWQAKAIAQGLILGVGVSLVFSLPPLLDIRRIPPARVFRSESEPLKIGWPLRVTAATLVVLGVWAAASWQGGSLVIGSVFAGGLVAVVGVLTLGARTLSALAARLPRDHGRLWLRHGLSRLAQPGAATVNSIVALGLGVMIVLAMHLVERHLTGQLSAEIPDAPSSFLINIEREQLDDVRRVLDEHGARSVRVVPLVMARIRALDGVESDELLDRPRERRPSRWALRRQQRLTYYETLPPGNEVVEGALWSDPAVDEVSVEQEFANNLGVSIGSTITVDVQGTTVDLTVTSIRTVNWRTLSTNFFLVVEPGVLDELPQRRIATARLPAGGDQQVQDALAAAYPNITLIQVRDIIDRVLAMLTKVTVGVQLLGAFTVVAGVLILAGAISASYVRRGREVALLKTLGMTRRDVSTVFAVEYALVGIAAALIGGLAGTVLAWAVLTQVMEIPWEHRPLTYAGTVVLTVLLVVIAGLAASGRALAVRPIVVLRAQ
jgi:putative ABC transport system permease protein